MKLLELYLPIFAVLFSVSFDKIISSSIHHREGDQCDIKKSERICQKVKKCPVEAELVISGVELDICGIKQYDLVCCNKSSNKSSTNMKYESASEAVTESEMKKIVKREEEPGEKSKRMCDKYAESVFSYEDNPSGHEGTIKKDNCGIQETPLIVGGELAKPREFPHMAAIGLSPNGSDEKEWLCGGSLISERWILSAAHCAYTKSLTANYALLGDLKIESDDDADHSHPIELKIVERVMHPEYNPNEEYNDIVLFKLERNVEFNKYIRPICLNTDNKRYTGRAIATGWGAIETFGDRSQDLLKVQLDLFDMKQCRGLYRNTRNKNLRMKIPRGITTNNMVCAWEKDKDTCQGDSGGPLQIKPDNPYCMYSIIGITSFGVDCATDLPGVYTRVSHYIPWIESIVWP